VGERRKGIAWRSPGWYKRGHVCPRWGGATEGEERRRMRARQHRGRVVGLSMAVGLWLPVTALPVHAAGGAASAELRPTNASVVLIARGALEGQLVPIG